MEDKNEVFIRGMLVSKIVRDNSTTAVLSIKSSKEDKNSNYQYVMFRDELKDRIENIRFGEVVVIRAKAWAFRNKENGVSEDNIRLRGISVEPSIELMRRTVAVTGLPIYGLQFKDCARFDFSGSVLSIIRKPRYLSILLGVRDDDGTFSIIPLTYSGHGDSAALDDTFEYAHKGAHISVKGVITQTVAKGKPAEAEVTDDTEAGNAEETGKPQRPRYKNHYHITFFLRDINHEDDAEIFD